MDDQKIQSSYSFFSTYVPLISSVLLFGHRHHYRFCAYTYTYRQIVRRIMSENNQLSSLKHAEIRLNDYFISLQCQNEDYLEKNKKTFVRDRYRFDSKTTMYKNLTNEQMAVST